MRLIYYTLGGCLAANARACILEMSQLRRFFRQASLPQEEMRFVDRSNDLANTWLSSRQINFVLSQEATCMEKITGKRFTHRRQQMR